MSNEKHKELFSSYERLHFIGVDLKHKHKRITQLYRFINQNLTNISFDTIYDFHDVIRTKILRLLLAKKAKKVRVFNKDRKSKKKIISKKWPLIKLEHTTERYKNCLCIDYPILKEKKLDKIIAKTQIKKKKIGIAPFAAHSSKIWPLNNYKDIISNYSDYEFIIFGFGNNEVELTNDYFLNYPNCKLIDQDLSIKNQIKLINEFCVFITMDSANMHLSSLTNTQVISIWGPTHPFIGFGPLFNEENIIQIEHSELPCRPCSVYGKIKSKDENCAKLSMEKISAEMVINQMEICLKKDGS